MKTFKESIQEDITKIFFDLKVFGDMHDVDGCDMNIIVDNEELKRRNDRQSVHSDGLYMGAILFFAAKRDFKRMPEVGGLLRLDGDTYRILDAIEHDGVMEVVLEANLS